MGKVNITKLYCYESLFDSADLDRESICFLSPKIMSDSKCRIFSYKVIVNQLSFVSVNYRNVFRSLPNILFGTIANG